MGFPYPTPRMEDEGIESNSFASYPIDLTEVNKDILSVISLLLSLPQQFEEVEVEGVQQESEFPNRAIYHIFLLFFPLSQ